VDDKEILMIGAGHFWTYTFYADGSYVRKGTHRLNPSEWKIVDGELYFKHEEHEMFALWMPDGRSRDWPRQLEGLLALRNIIEE
jgi:hypothetical protein